MSNYLKSELYKLSNRAYPFVLAAFGAASAIILNLSVWYSLHVLDIPFSIEGSDILLAGLYILSSIIWYLIIFTTDIGFSGEWRNNTMKNCVSYGTSRNTIFFGKCIMSIFILLMGILIITISYVFSNLLCFHGDASLTMAVYSEYFTRLLLMLPLIIAGQCLASSLSMLFSTDLLWCGIYAVLIALIPNGIMLINTIFQGNELISAIYNCMPTTCLYNLAFRELTLLSVIRCMIVAGVMAGIPMIISVIVFNKKEIK